MPSRGDGSVQIAMMHHSGAPSPEGIPGRYSAIIPMVRTTAMEPSSHPCLIR